MATIALDIGGTKVSGAVFFPDGNMMFAQKQLLRGRTGEEVGALAGTMMRSLLAVAEKNRIAITGVGVCVPGIVYSTTGRVWAPNIPGWDNYPLTDELAAQLPEGISLVVESDRTCYILGEMWQGAARGCHSAVFIAVGTGIGAGIVIDGHLLHGAGDIIGATGWQALELPYRKEFDQCGCFEYYASGTGIGARGADAVEAAGAGCTSRLARINPRHITAHDVLEAAASGDALAGEVVDKAIDMWAMGSSNIVSLLNPQKVVWGGGVFGAAVPLIPEIYKRACQWGQPIAMQQVQYVASELAGNAGLAGAAFLPLQKQMQDQES